jgi:hypothetical protein
MPVAAAIALTVILAVLAVFQLALALGAPLGHFAWGGQHRVLPTKLRIGSLVSILIYAVIALLALDRVDLIDVVPDGVSTVGMWIVFAYFVLGIPLNAVSRSKPERFTMTPIVAVLAVLSLLVALG